MAEYHLSKVCRDCGILKSTSLFSKKERGILGVRPECNECRGNSRRKRYAEDEAYRGSILATQKQRNAENPEKNRQKTRDWAKKNPDRVKAAATEYRKKEAAKVDAYKKKWAKNNRHMTAAACARRAATKLRASMPWRNEFFINQVYDIARLRSQMTGFKWHVDHIVPLRSDVVCGLHVEANLQVIPATANKLKSNIWWPDMP